MDCNQIRERIRNLTLLRLLVLTLSCARIAELFFMFAVRDLQMLRIPVVTKPFGTTHRDDVDLLFGPFSSPVREVYGSCS